jgi:hypothetical protein
MRVLSRAALLASLGACSSSSTGLGLAPYLANETVPGVSVSLTVTPTRVAPGDSMEFAATAQNSTPASVQIGVQCGPSFDIVLTGQRGYVASVLSLMVGPNGAFTCELSSRHFAPANGTQEVRFRIPAPERLGQYRAVAGLRRSDGLSNLSPSVAIEVR